MTSRLVNRRPLSCLQPWPDADSGAHNPACCRFPKSCSATVYGDETPDDLLEPGPETQPGSLADLGRVLPNLDDDQLAEAHNALYAAGCGYGVDRHGIVHFDPRTAGAYHALRDALDANAASAPPGPVGAREDADAPPIAPATAESPQRAAPVATPNGQPGDLAVILDDAARWIKPCGSCDAGLATGCTCPDGDPRAVIAALVDIVLCGPDPEITQRDDEIERLTAALKVCGHALHRVDPTDGEVHAAQQASGAPWTDWTPAELADDVPNVPAEAAALFGQLISGTETEVANAR